MPLPRRGIRRDRRERRRRRGQPTTGGEGSRDPINRWDDYMENFIRIQKEGVQPIAANTGGLVKSGISRYKDIYTMENK